MLFWHGRHYDDGDDTAHDDEEHAGMLRVRHQLVGEYHDGGRKPQHEDVCDIDMPSLTNIASVV